MNKILSEEENKHHFQHSCMTLDSVMKAIGAILNSLGCYDYGEGNYGAVKASKMKCVNKGILDALNSLIDQAIRILTVMRFCDTHEMIE